MFIYFVYVFYLFLFFCNYLYVLLSAGGVDEDEFVRSFENVPKIHVSTALCICVRLSTMSFMTGRPNGQVRQDQ